MKNTNQIIKMLVIGLTTALIATPTELSAKCKGGKCKGGGSKAQQQAQKEREQEKQMREARLKIVKEYMEPIDKNNDGSISLDEFLAYNGGDGAKDEFDRANKNGDRYLSKTEIGEMIKVDEKVSKQGNNKKKCK